MTPTTVTTANTTATFLLSFPAEYTPEQGQQQSTEPGEEFLFDAFAVLQPRARSWPQDAGAAVQQVRRRRLQVAGEHGSTPRGIADRAAGAGLAVHQQIGHRPRQRDQHRDQGGSGSAPQKSPGTHAARHQDECDRRERDPDATDDSVVDGADGLEPQHDPKHHRVAAPLALEEAMQPQERQRHEVQRLELDVPEMREMVGGESEDQPRNVRRTLAAGQFPGQHVHRQGRGHERTEEQHVVAEDQIAGDGVDGPERHSLRQQVVGVGQRARGGKEDVRVEHAPGEQPGRVF